MSVMPPPPRHTSEDLGNSFLISIPSRKQWAWVFLLVVWLSVWALIESLLVLPAIRTAATGIGPPNSLDWPFWVGWTAFGIFSIYVLLWTVAGREVVEINGQAIGIRLAILGLGIAKEYDALKIKWLPIFPTAESGGFHMPRGYSAHSSFWWSRGEGRLGFDYDSKKHVRFGIDIDEAEANQILAEIQQRYPQYKSKS
jgi:hypothetical protein